MLIASNLCLTKSCCRKWTESAVEMTHLSSVTTMRGETGKRIYLMHLFISLFFSTHTRMHTYTHTDRYTHTCACVRTYAYMHAGTQTHTHTHTHFHVSPSLFSFHPHPALPLLGFSLAKTVHRLKSNRQLMAVNEWHQATATLGLLNTRSQQCTYIALLVESLLTLACAQWHVWLGSTHCAPPRVFCQS